MKRRDFLGKTLPAGVLLPSLISGFSLKAFGSSSLLSALTAASEETDHVLVIIQLFFYFLTTEKAQSKILNAQTKILKQKFSAEIRTFADYFF